MQKAAKACARCGVRDCQNPAHKPKPFKARNTRERDKKDRLRRPRASYAEEMRRKAAVDAYKRVWGHRVGNRVVADCPMCGLPSFDLTADHIIPFGVCGHEDSPLRVICRSCNSRLGAQLRWAKRRAQ